MKMTELERNVLLLLTGGDLDQEVLREQIERATVHSRDYTGVGFYTKFNLPEGTRRFDSRRWKTQDMPQTFGKHPALPAGAGFILWLKDVLIDTLEGYTYEGNWPKDESQFVVTKSQQRLAPDETTHG